MIHVFGSHPLHLTLTALALLFVMPVAFAGAAPDGGRSPNLGDCQNLLQVAADQKVAFHAYAEGVQIYGWTGASWALVGPEAVLFADAEGHGVVGFHYAGPTWQTVSGGKVVGAVLERCTPEPDAIPWLLLQALAAEGPGIFQRTTFIQRLNTVGGLAPTEPGDFPGEQVRVPYTAEYFFYRRHH
jgi:Protein of unknown function (DUF3455)